MLSVIVTATVTSGVTSMSWSTDDRFLVVAETNRAAIYYFNHYTKTMPRTSDYFDHGALINNVTWLTNKKRSIILGGEAGTINNSGVTPTVRFLYFDHEGTALFQPSDLLCFDTGCAIGAIGYDINSKRLLIGGALNAEAQNSFLVGFMGNEYQDTGSFHMVGPSSTLMLKKVKMDLTQNYVFHTGKIVFEEKVKVYGGKISFDNDPKVSIHDR
jgi:hypothetical protein